MHNVHEINSLNLFAKCINCLPTYLWKESLILDKDIEKKRILLEQFKIGKVKIDQMN